jgi:hypothetical protein
MGQILDYIVAAMAASPVTLKFEPEGVDEFYHEFYQDVTPPSSRKMSFNQMLRGTLYNALCLRDSWTLIELPAKGDKPIRTKADEEAEGMLDAYACIVDPEAVVDWEYDEDGELLWALVCNVERRRPGLGSRRDTVHEQYTYYDRAGWEKWGFTYKLMRDGQPKLPADKDPATLEGKGKHSFGKVPLVRFQLPDGLWAGNKICNLAESHLNKRSAFDWGQKRSLFQFLAVHLDKGTALNPITEDPKRAVNQKVGPGRVMQLGANDKIGYVSPDAEPYKVALEDMGDLRTEMFRVMHHMALSQDNSAASLKRSGDSKKQDASATAVVLKGLGEILREYAEEVIEMVARGRKEYGKGFEVEAQGADEFDDVALDSLVEEASVVHTAMKPKSAHFVKRYDLKVYKRLLGTDLTDEDVEIMQKELEANVTNEDLMAPDMGQEPDGDEPADDKPQVDEKPQQGKAKPKKTLKKIPKEKKV